MENHSEVL